MFNVPSDLSWRVTRIPKKTPGKFRTLHIPNDDLKDEQRKILTYLYTVDELRPASMACGFVPYRNTCTGLLRHNKKSRVIITLDVKNFFDNFPVKKVQERLIAAGIPAADVDDIIKICTFEGTMLPQGAPTSPALTNIGMLETDLMIASYAAKHGFTYSRYADDLAFFSTEEKDAEIDMREEALNRQRVAGQPRKRVGFAKFIMGVDFLLKETLGIHLNMEKNQVIRSNSPHKSPRVTGVVIRRDGMGFNAPRFFRLKTRAGIHRLYMALKDGRKPSTSEYARFYTLFGRVVYMDHVRAYSAEGFNTADPFIKQTEFEELLAIIQNSKRKGNKNGRKNGRKRVA